MNMVDVDELSFYKPIYTSFVCAMLNLRSFDLPSLKWCEHQPGEQGVLVGWVKNRLVEQDVVSIEMRPCR